ncbi:serine/threonine protein kinase [Deinococcus aerolatus]|uniref:Serine/threonine protein kinase n=1 Tax=Deinococcus aerolatus TaxID=522487 RepID=A0ABQ2G3E5_9DEIO|nr:serine/threonine-protein kinase [Deinococcus aerolatus]GGL72630.1 serine/threonine protein kinase [Deinococcus aerolatus]
MALAGQVVGDGVRLIRPIGRGSHSLVYFAVDAQGQPCAVKVFLPEMQDFAEREYQHSRGLDHPRLAYVLGRGALEGRPVLISTLARGEVLFSRYTRRPALRVDRRAFLLTLAHLLDALAYLHSCGLVHRDIKPENIVVEPDGSAKLVDLDLSGPALEAFPVPTRFGTAAFQSPEASRGEPLGPEADLYGVGMLLGWGIFGALPDPTGSAPYHPDPLCPLYLTLTRQDRGQRPADAAWVRERILKLSNLNI